jgi:hypothetical protein
MYTVPEAGTGSGQLPVSGWMKVRAVVSNAAGMTRTFETPVRVVSDMTVSIKLLPCDYDGRGLGDDSYPFPILLTAYNKNDVITSWKLKIVSPDKATNTIDLDAPNAHYATTTYNYDPYAGGNSLLQGTYTFQLEAVCASETARSEVISMDVIKEQNWDPMAEVNFASITQASDIAEYRWERQIINDLDFIAGDFIETDMDIHRCLPIAYDGTSANDVGMDLLLSIGLNGIDWVPWVLNVQFPAVDNGNSGLYINPTWLEGKETKYAGYIYGFPDSSLPLHFRLEKGGAYWNGQKIDAARWGTNQNKVLSVIDKLTAANTLYIGSTEGGHRSRAIYRFIRVVHNGRASSTKGGDSHFKDNPGYGGQL